MQNTTGARRLLEILAHHGIDTVAGIPGGNILPLYDALHGFPIRHVLARHEQGAAFLAQGIARSTGRIGVCLATSGPGATNLLTGVADAFRDSIPLLAITGQVPRASIGTQAFQEIDIITMATACTKAAWRVESATQLDALVPEAIATALSGRPGPVWIDIPKDVFLESCPDRPLPDLPARHDAAIDPAELAKASRELGQAHHPLLYLGGGMASPAASEAVRAFARARGIPVASTLLGLGALPTDDALFVGMLGMHGHPAANQAIESCDLLIVAGARFDDRATGRIADFAQRARVVHLDIDRSEFGRRRAAHATVHGDAAAIFRAWHALDRSPPREDWTRALREAHPLPGQAAHDLLRAIAWELPARRIATTDVGQHQMWAAQAWPVRKPRQFLTSGGLGTMGFGLPAAIGAALANPGTPVVCLTGDGSILMNLQELATLSELDLPVKICVFDNGGLGMVRQQQTQFYSDRRIASAFGARPDLAAVAEGFGIPSRRVDDWRADESWTELLRTAGPSLLVFAGHLEETVWPVVPPGAANREMLLPGPVAVAV